MEHYVTLFDSLFLPQGLALHASMERHAGRHTLWVLCVDDKAFAVLERLQLPNVRTIPLAMVETDALRAVKPGRSRGEYCWTLTSFAPGFVFDRDPTAERVTYVDADTWLCRSPREIFGDFESSGKAVLITEHGYAPEHDQTMRSGRFCVQWITFVRGRGEMVRNWWSERCIEWCFARFEEGRFGDQKYLDDWPARFAHQVHILSPVGLMQAPWCGSRFAPGEASLFHFHGLRLLRNGRVLLNGDYKIGETTRQALYAPYLADFRRAVQQLTSLGCAPPAQMETSALRLHLKLVVSHTWRWLRRPRGRRRIAAL